MDESRVLVDEPTPPEARPDADPGPAATPAQGSQAGPDAHPGYDAPSDYSYPQAGFGSPPPTYPASYVEGGGIGPRRPRRLLAGTTLVAVAIAGGAAGAVLTRHFDGTHVGSVLSASPVSLGSGSTAPTEQLAKVAAAVEPSVVSIMVSGPAGSDEGSGVIIGSDGTILTNNHVIAAAADGSGSINVRFASGRTAAATIVGRDPATDLAVIKAAGVSGLTPATLGSTTGLHVGDTVLAIGSPLGLEGSVSSGIVSALHRTVNVGDGSGNTNAVGDAVQTDAAINPGNSGGPLVDVQGHVVGITTAIATLGGGFGGQSGSIGLGFAIPIDEASAVANDLLSGKTPSHAQLGVEVGDAQSGGAIIGRVSPGSAAAKAGLQVGDIITAVGSTQVDGADTLTAAIRAHRPGDQVVITYLRQGAARSVTLSLGGTTS